MVSTIPIDLLTLKQRNSIQPSSIRLSAYGNQHVKNFGQISLDLVFENGVVLKNQDLLVVDSGIMMVLGTNVLFPEHGESLFSLDRERLKATLLLSRMALPIPLRSLMRCSQSDSSRSGRLREHTSLASRRVRPTRTIGIIY